MTEQQFLLLPNISYLEIFNFYRKKGFDAPTAYKEIKKIKFSFMKKIQKFRTLIGRPIRFNSITEGKHAKNSSHPKGIAGDIRIGGKGAINWNKMVQHALTCGFVGIGYYPFWNTPGLHLDTRAGGIKLWKRLRNGKYVGFI